MSKVTFVLNPMAGKGAGRKLKKRILDSIRSKISSFELVETAGPLDATLVARQCSSSVVVAAGGDGTIHEVVNGIVGSQKALGIIPIGSGNDFVKSVGIPVGIDEAVSVIADEKIRLIDVGRSEVWSEGLAGPSGEYFINGVGVGFDAAVAERTRHIRYLTGTMLYFAAVLQTLSRYTSPQFSITIDGRTVTSRNLLIAIGNGICAGGGFYLTPNARVDDGLLDICMIDELRTSAIIRLMPFVMKGNHEHLPQVKSSRGATIQICPSDPISVHADGEILGSTIKRVEIEVVPQALKVLVS